MQNAGRRTHGALALTMVLLGAPLVAATSTDDAEGDVRSGKWMRAGKPATVETYAGEDCLGAEVELQGIVFENGTIELDLALPPKRELFIGLDFRIQEDRKHWERVHLRPFTFISTV